MQTDPQDSHQFKKVWLWNEFPGKKDLGGNDTGIDLVAITHSNEYWAIQCKCYQESSTIDKPAVDSFLATSSREFKGEDLKTTKFTQRLWISTTNKWGPRAGILYCCQTSLSYRNMERQSGHDSTGYEL